MCSLSKCKLSGEQTDRPRRRIAQRAAELIAGTGVPADIPVVTLSVNPDLDPADWFKIGQAVASLRAEGVLIIGSGVTVQNFRARAALFAYATQAPHGTLAVPPHGKEHFAPLLYAFGAGEDKNAKLLHLSWRAGSLSHSVYQFGA